MEVSGSKEKIGKKTLHPTVGGLVWVQRRNGSWWPGQIVDLVDLSGNCSNSPRSGTPIKLLGRDDLSVEWYDLETTKVVKDFRCGEYDACIEKAKVSAPKFLKRASKNHRREIAIFHALEIENSRLVKTGSNLNDNHLCLSEKTDSELTTSVCEVKSNSVQDVFRSSISYGNTNRSNCLKGQHYNRKRKTPLDSDDEGNEPVPRMKSLVEIYKVAKRVDLPSSVLPKTTQIGNGKKAKKLTTENNFRPPKKKRSPVVHINEVIRSSKRSRYPSIKVIENATMENVQRSRVEFTNIFERSNTTKTMDKLHKSLPIVNSSNTLFDVPLKDKEQGASGVWQPYSLKPHVDSKRNYGNKFRIRASYVEPEASNNERGHVYYTTNVNQEAEKSTFRWEPKGNTSASYLWNNSGNLMNSSSTKGLINGFSSHRSFSPRQLCFSTSKMLNVPSLYEVEVTVEASRFQVKRVPYVSFVSKVSGKPITGHPVTVEVLEEGSCDIETIDYPSSGRGDFDEDVEEDFVVEPKKQTCKQIKLQPNYSCHNKKSFESKKGSHSKQKTRSLDSIPALEEPIQEEIRPMFENYSFPTLACVPLSLVFCRLKESLNRPSRHGHRAQGSESPGFDYQ